MTPKTLAQKQLAKILKPTYFSSIPLDEMFEAVESNGGMVIDEAGEAWSGFLCGEAGQALLPVIGIKGIRSLCITWYKMQSGRYEVCGYLS